MRSDIQEDPKAHKSHSSYHSYKLPKMVEGFAKIIKYALFVANCIILICGIVVFSVGVWTLADRSFMERLLGTDLYVSSASILIATGVIVTVISFLGCFGALKEVKCMLLTFFIILFMIFIVMLVGGILGYVFRNEVEEQMHVEMLATIPLYKKETAVTEAWDAVQEQFECCGIRTTGASQSPDIWRQKGGSYFQNYVVPESCCKMRNKKEEIESCQRIPTDDNSYKEDCYMKMKDAVKDHAMILGGVGIGISCVLIIGMVLSCALFLMIN